MGKPCVTKEGLVVDDLEPTAGRALRKFVLGSDSRMPKPLQGGGFDKSVTKRYKLC